MICRKSAESHEGADGWGIDQFGKGAQFLAGIGCDDAAAGVDKGPLSFPNHLGSAPDLATVTFTKDAIAGKVDFRYRDVVGLALEDIFRDVDEDRAGASGGRNVKGFVDDLRQFLNIFHQKIMLGGRASDAEGVSFLEGVASHQLGGHLAGDGDDGDGIHHGVDETSDEIRGAGPGSGAANAYTSGGTGITLGSKGRVLLVPRS